MITRLFTLEEKLHVAFYRCTSGVECWNAELVKVTSETIASAVNWVAQTPPQTPPIKTNIAEALIKALSLTEVRDTVCVPMFLTNAHTTD